MASAPKPAAAARPGAPAVDAIAEEDLLEKTPTVHEPEPDKAARADTGSSSSSSSSNGESSSSTPSDRPRRMPTAATEATAPDDYSQSPPGRGGADDLDDDEPAAPPKPPLLKRLGLDPTTLKLMFKGSIVPIIALAMYQADSVAATYSTLGYLIPIIASLSTAILPRGKFLMILVLNVLATSIAAAFSLLVLYSSVKAREHTSAPLTAQQLQVYKATGVPPYNSSQSAVLAVWLFFGVWLVNMVRAKLPAFILPSIVFSIVLNISCTYGPHFATMVVCESFIRRLYTAMLTAYGLAAAISLLVFPLSSRRILMLQTTGAIGLLRKAVALQGEYLRGLEGEDMYALVTVETAVGNLGPAEEEERRREKDRRRHFKRANKKPPPPPLTKEARAAQALRTTIGAIHELAGKMQQEVVFAKRDAAFGKLTAHDLGEIVKLLRAIIVPVTGMSTIMDIFRRTADKRGWNTTDDLDEEQAALKSRERRVWNEIMKQLHEPFILLSEAIDQGLEHAGIQLALLPQTKEQKALAKQRRKERQAKKTAKGAHGAAPSESGGDPGATPAGADVEASGGILQPGDEGFSGVIEDKVRTFYKTRGEILRIWARERGLLDGPTTAQPSNSSGIDPVFVAREQRQSQLYVLLYMEHLMVATGEAVRDFVEFADSKVNDGTMDQTRFLFPTLRRLRKWALGVFDEKDQVNADTVKSGKVDYNVVFLGDSFNEKKDPEHLPAENAWEHFGNGLRRVSAFLGSSESLFGLRAACATMTVAIVCYLEHTQTFFQEQRLVWALIIISISMTQTSGQSIFGFFCRVFGSFLAMVFAYIIWYIVDEKTAGVLVFMWLFLFVDYYFLIKYPRFTAASMIMIITQVLIIGYELQVRKIGIKLSESSGQRFYPTYLLGPYRLATVSGGCLVAFIWTIFPQPVTDRAWLRRDLSATLFMIGTYFSVVNETLRSEMNQTGGDSTVPGTPAHRLAKVRQTLFSKLMTMLPSLQMHSAWQKWEPTIGGAYPRAAYEDIILRTGRMLNYLTLISYTVAWKPRHSEREKDAVWLQSLKDLVKSIGPTHYTILSTLSLLSNSLQSGQALPPYIPLPRPYELTRQLLALKRSSPPGEEGDKSGENKGAAAAAGGKRRNSVADPSPGVRRRNSLWSRPTWKQNKEAGDGTGAAAAGATGSDHRQGLFELTNEADAVLGGALPIQRQRTAASSGSHVPDWREVMETGVNTATGDATLMRVPTQQAQAPAAGKLGSSVLDASNIEKHGYTEFAMLQVCSTLVCDDLEGLIQSVSGLVGVVDFSFIVDHGVKGKDVTDKGKGKKE